MIEVRRHIRDILHNSSAAAEVGDRARAKWAEKWGGAAVLLSMAG